MWTGQARRMIGREIEMLARVGLRLRMEAVDESRMLRVEDEGRARWEMLEMVVA